VTEFRSKGKGKDRKVYPVGTKRKPFGISRELAYEDVEALRQKGERARLIKTNRKLDLYAPYVADVNVPDMETPPASAVQQASSIPENNAKRETAIPVDDATAIMTAKEAEGKYRMQPPTIMTEDGKALITMVDQSHIMAGWMALKDKPTSEAISEFNGMNKAIRVPALDYGTGTSTVELGVQDRNNIRMLVQSLAKEMSDDGGKHTGRGKWRKYKPGDFRIVFEKPDEGRYGYVAILPGPYDSPDDDKTYGKAMRVQMDGPKGSFAMYGADTFLTTIKLYNSLTAAPKGRKSRGDTYYLTLKDDYPFALSRENAAGRKLTDIPSGVLLAPIIVNQSDVRQAREVVSKLTGEA